MGPNQTAVMIKFISVLEVTGFRSKAFAFLVTVTFPANREKERNGTRKEKNESRCNCLLLH